MKPRVGEIALLALATAIPLGAILGDWTPLLRGPAPYPPEWQWPLRAGPTSGHWLGVAAAAAGVLLLIGFTATAAARRHPRRTARLVLASGILLGWGFGLGLLALEPEGALRTLLVRTLSRTINSYYTVAVSPEARDPREFLARHAELLPVLRKAAKHAATHPPAPVLYYRGLIGLCEGSPRLTEAVLRAASVEAVERPESRHTPASRAAAILGGLWLGLLAAASAWPIAAVARRLGCGDLAAARVGLVWVLVPGPLLFTPQFDQALALPVALATAALLAALAKDTPARTSILLSLLAGGAAGVAFGVSYGAAAFLALAGAAALTTSWDSSPGAGRGGRVTALAAFGALLMLAVPVAFGHQSIQAARTALAIHRDLYTAPRSYPLWLAFNPVDLAVFLGVPLALLAAARTSASLEVAVRGGLAALSAADRFRLALGAGLLLLLVSGTVRGETGRLLIPLMPLCLVAGLVAGEDRDQPRPALAATMGLCLALLALALRVHWQL